MSRTDEELLDAWAAGGRAEGTELFRRHFASCRRFFYNKVPEADVEDLLQKSFAGLVESRDRYRGDASVRTFLFSIARNMLLKYLREFARRGSRHEPDMNVSSIALIGITPGTAIAKEEEHEQVRLALQRIPVHLQTVVELHYWEGVSQADLATILDVEPATVRSRLFRAKKALAKELEGRLGPDEAALDQAARELGAKI